MGKIAIGETICLEKIDGRYIHNTDKYIIIPRQVSYSLIKMSGAMNKGLLLMHTHLDYDYISSDKKKYWKKMVNFSDADIKYICSFVKVYEKYRQEFKANFIRLPVVFTVINNYSYQTLVWMGKRFENANIRNVSLMSNSCNILLD